MASWSLSPHASLYRSQLSKGLVVAKKPSLATSFTSNLRLFPKPTYTINSFKTRAASQNGSTEVRTRTVVGTDMPVDAGFSLEKGVFKLDHPTQGFSSIPEAIEDIRSGKIVIVVDDENRENEGDLIMAAQFATPKAMAFFVKHGTGIVCVTMKEQDLDRLHLPQMVDTKLNEEKLSAAFTISVDAKDGTTTGVSADDRAITVRALASGESKPEDFIRPGHIFPLKYREGGVLKRPGHTEASVDLVLLAGLRPVGVIVEIVDEDGSMARLPSLRKFAKQEDLKIVCIADLIRYRRKIEKLVEVFSSAS